MFYTVEACDFSIWLAMGLGGILGAAGMFLFAIAAMRETYREMAKYKKGVSATSDPMRP